MFANQWKWSCINHVLSIHALKPSKPEDRGLFVADCIRWHSRSMLRKCALQSWDDPSQVLSKATLTIPDDHPTVTERTCQLPSPVTSEVVHKSICIAWLHRCLKVQAKRTLKTKKQGSKQLVHIRNSMKVRWLGDYNEAGNTSTVGSAQRKPLPAINTCQPCEGKQGQFWSSLDLA